MSEYRVLVTTQVGEVVAVEFHGQAATASERAAMYQQAGYVVDVTEGRRGEDGTFEPASVEA